MKLRKLVTLDDRIANGLRKIAKEKGLSVVALIRMILAEYISNHKT